MRTRPLIQQLTALGGACLLGVITLLPGTLPAQTKIPAKKLDALKKELIAAIDQEKVFTQQMVDMVFSFGELGFQEFETSRYLVDILKKNGFTVEEGIAGIPTAWTARWGSGKPVIAVGSDIDC